MMILEHLLSQGLIKITSKDTTNWHRGTKGRGKDPKSDGGANKVDASLPTRDRDHTQYNP